MDNITWCSNKKEEDVKNEEVKVESISTSELSTQKNELLLKCDELINSSKELYDKASSKELYDSIITLMSVKNSLNTIHIKQPIVNKIEE